MLRKKASTVGAYIATAPREMRPRLKQVRAAIRQAAPRAAEGIGYSMPYYYLDNDELSWQERSIAWFALQSGHIGLYLPPPIIAEHERALKGYSTTKSAVHLPLDKPVPIALIKKLVRARLKKQK